MTDNNRNSFDNQSDTVVCKYCLENKFSCKETFITPCNCTNPVCIACFNKRKLVLNPRMCEICHVPYTNQGTNQNVVIDIGADLEEQSIDNNWSCRDIIKVICYICGGTVFVIFILILFMLFLAFLVNKATIW